MMKKSGNPESEKCGMVQNYYTTSQVAEILSVSSDTVLRWVRSGKIPSYRTLGGHSRIPAQVIEGLVRDTERADRIPAGLKGDQPHLRCWDFYAQAGGESTCRECPTFRSRSRRCYEIRFIPEDFEQLGLSCPTSCQKCEYFRIARPQATSALIVSRSEKWLRKLGDQAVDPELVLRFARSEYECARVVEEFRPDFFVLDSGVGTSRTREICRHLHADPRVPISRVLITSRRPRWSEACDREICGWIKKPFSATQLRDLVTGVGRA